MSITEQIRNDAKILIECIKKQNSNLELLADVSVKYFKPINKIIINNNNIKKCYSCNINKNLLWCIINGKLFCNNCRLKNKK